MIPGILHGYTTEMHKDLVITADFRAKISMPDPSTWKYFAAHPTKSFGPSKYHLMFHELEV
jgi:hypothetical protein